MAYLHRRIEHLQELVKTGKLKFLKGDQKQEQLIEELMRVRRLESGEVDIETCSPLVRSFARMMYATKDMRDPSAQPKEETMPFDLEDVNEYQREYFALLDDTFRRTFGKAAKDFAAPNDFVDEMKKFVGTNPHDIAGNVLSGLSEISDFHAKHMGRPFGMSRCLQGMKLVLGGTSRFTPTHLGALRQVMLYADTFLIPDPVLPWLEEQRQEEKFGFVQPLVQIHTLLQLKPLIDADLPYPAVVVFPSFERSLMKHDPVTNDGIGRLYLDFFGHYLDTSFGDETEIERYVVDKEAEFLSHVEKKALFIASDQSIGASLQTMLASYRKDVKEWRTKEHSDAAEEMSDGRLALQGIMERLQPQYHMRENAEELGAQPMMCTEAHAHYFKLCADVFNDSLADNTAISAENLSALRALDQPEFKWLTNVPIEVLAKLRADGENEDFRRRIAEYVGQLHECKLEDLDRVSYEVNRGIRSLLQEHDKAVQALDTKYRRKFGKMALTNWIGVAATFYPALAPFLADPVTTSAALVAGGYYLKEKIAQLRESRQLSRSLTGVLARARSDESQ